LEWTDTYFSYEYVSVTTTAGNRQITAVLSTHRQTQREFMQFWQSEMRKFHPHDVHVK
jgi:hypothetical protein